MQAEMTKTKIKNTKRANRKRKKRSKRRQEKAAAAASVSTQRKPSANGTFLPSNHDQNTVWALAGIQIWRQTYENAIKWHNEHQFNFWRQRAQHFQKENEVLKQWKESCIGIKEEYETSDDGEEDDYEHNFEINISTSEQPQVDEEYMKFLEITQKHREELRKAREQEQVL